MSSPLGRLVRAAGWAFYSDAEGGAGVNAFPPSRVRRAPASRAVVVSLGGNDRGATWRLKTIGSDVAAFVRAATGPVWWIAMPFGTLPDRIGVNGVWCANATHVIDPGTDIAWSDVRASDGVHLSPRGYERLAALVWQAVRGGSPGIAPRSGGPGAILGGVALTALAIAMYRRS